MKPSRRAVKTIGMRVLQLARTVPAELAQVRRLVFRGLDLHHEISVQRNDIKQQVELLRLPADFNRILAADERDQPPERKQGPLDVRHNGGLELLFAVLLRQAEHLEILRVFDQPAAPGRTPATARSARNSSAPFPRARRGRSQAS